MLLIQGNSIITTIAVNKDGEMMCYLYCAWKLHNLCSRRRLPHLKLTLLN